MLFDFFHTVRKAGVPASVKEYLTLLEAIKAGVIDDDDGPTVDKFYYLARTSLVKDEAQFDKFDRAFAAYFKGVDMVADFSQDIPLEWLQKKLELELSPEEKAAIEKMGWDELMDTLDSYIPVPERLVDRPFLMSVENVYHVEGRGTVATGRVERGRVQAGNEVEIIGLARQGRRSPGTDDAD